MARAVDTRMVEVAAPGSRTVRLVVPAERPRPVVIASYARPRTRPNLTALLALLLERYGIPVVVHGPESSGDGDGDGDGGAATFEVLRELGIAPVCSLAEADAQLKAGRLAYVPATLIASARGDAMPDPDARRVAALLDPFGGAGLRIVGASDAVASASIRAILAATSGDALLLRATAGEPFADPCRPPRIEWFQCGKARILVDARPPERLPAGFPAPGSASAIAAWSAGALAGTLPIPGALLDQLASCIYAVGREGARN